MKMLLLTIGLVAASTAGAQTQPQSSTLGLVVITTQQQQQNWIQLQQVNRQTEQNTITSSQALAQIQRKPDLALSIASEPVTVPPLKCTSKRHPSSKTRNICAPAR